MQCMWRENSPTSADLVSDERNMLMASVRLVVQIRGEPCEWRITYYTSHDAKENAKKAYFEGSFEEAKAYAVVLVRMT
jgi:hypothetical protein